MSLCKSICKVELVDLNLGGWSLTGITVLSEVVSLSKNINPSLVLVQPRKTHPYIAEKLLMGCKESNQTNSGPCLFISPQCRCSVEASKHDTVQSSMKSFYNAMFGIHRNGPCYN